MTNPFTGFTLYKIAHNATPDILQVYINDKGYLADWNFLDSKKQQGVRKYAEAINLELKKITKTDGKFLGELIKIYALSKRDALLGFLHCFRSAIDQETLDYINSLSNNYDKAITLLLKSPEGFKKYYCLYTADIQPEKYWSIREDYIPNGAAALTGADIERLQNEIKQYLQSETGSSQCVCDTVEYKERQYIFLMTGDLPKHEEIWQENEVTGTILSPIYKIAIVYDPKAREVDIYCRDKKTRTAIHKIFALEKFRKEIPNNPNHPPIYSIESVIASLVAKKKLEISIPAKSCIKDIWIKSISFNWLAKAGKFVIESSLNTRKPNEGQVDHIYALLRRFFKLDSQSSNTTSLEEVKAYHIKFVVEYADIYDGSVQKKTFTFSGKDNTNLGHSDIDRDIKACFQESGYIKKNNLLQTENYKEIEVA